MVIVTEKIVLDVFEYATVSLILPSRLPVLWWCAFIKVVKTIVRTPMVMKSK
jgi:hypothetical protein